MQLIREWIIFALCLGVGGHIALGFILHAPALWPWSRAGLYGLLSGVAVYVLVQVSRLLWRAAQKRHVPESSSADV
ncbi:MAG: hypothetical protein HY038_09160 [Nitrospirae bacterium]|nr:hypothetical protein [Nitrospirota bacterium]